MDPETHERRQGGWARLLLGLAPCRFSKPSILRTAVPCLSPLPCPALPCPSPCPPGLHCSNQTQPISLDRQGPYHLPLPQIATTLSHTLTQRTAPHRVALACSHTHTHTSSRTGLADCFAATSSFDAASIPKHHPPKPYHPALPGSRPRACDLTPDPSIKPDPLPLPQRYTHTPISHPPQRLLIHPDWAQCRVVLSLVLTARGN